MEMLEDEEGSFLGMY